MKIILLLTPFDGDYFQWETVFHRIISGACPNSRCLFVDDLEYLSHSDAVILYGSHLITNSSMNLTARRETSVNKSIPWIFMSYESPDRLRDYFGVRLWTYNGFFNWTMTYREDSDLVSKFGEVYLRHSKEEKEKELEFSPKNKFNDTLAVCMVSHCKTNSKRENLIMELQRYMKIDVYGKCGNKRCGSPRYIEQLRENSNDPCEEITKKYYFYLAFENSLCKDYVSEKFFRALRLGVVPVVLGGANYTAIAPPHSFINVQDFPSVSDLVDYLKKVADDPQLYQGYLQWQKEYGVKLYHPYDSQVCNLCSKLHSGTFPPKTYDIFEWFDTESKCYSWSEK